MKLSIYTFVKDGLFYDFHVVEMLKHHLDFADEIIVNEGFSNDKTYKKIKDIHPKIKIFRNNWDSPDPTTWHKKFKNQTLKYCTGDWCIMLDCDEFIPEWQFEPIKCFLRETDKVILSITYLNFYGNYKVYVKKPKELNWTERRFVIHRNLPEIEVWGDGANVRLRGKDKKIYGSTEFECHHFGYVRHASILRKKWREQSATYGQKKFKWLKIPMWVYKMFPHNWFDPDILPYLDIYPGPYIKAVKNNPQEFIRDDFKLYFFLKNELP